MNLRNLEQRIKINPEREEKRILDFINNYLKILNREIIVLGVSGGLDSSVVLKLCSKVIDNKKILALIMPDKDTNKKHLRDALK
ncbi:MAG: NAD(+) synthase, partial [Candidatus Woesearchaeota archaeon]